MVTPWRVVAASGIGTSHLAEGSECQDAASCATFLSGQAFAAAVSDGAGSAKMSATGAKIASDMFVALSGEHLGRFGGISNLDNAAVDLWIGKIQASIEIEAMRADIDIREYACTLLGVVAHDGLLATFQIGDGAIAIGNRSAWQCMYWPQHGEYANQTFFVTEIDAWERLQFDVKSVEFDEIGIFSDGLERMLLHHETRSIHAPFFEGMMPAIRSVLDEGVDDVLSDQLSMYLTTETVNARTDDDKSLVLATRRLPSLNGHGPV